jgi:hypothetical protein
MNRRYFFLLTGAGIVLLVIFLTGCGGDASETGPIYTQLTEATLSPGDPIPVPANADDIMLTVSGKISHPNQGDAIVMDRATIERLGEVEYTVDDPFLEQTVTYRGVLLGDLLKVWGVTTDAQQMHLVALNDYEVVVPIEDYELMPVLFAMQVNGDYMPISTRGPAMLVYPYNHFDLDHTLYNNYWIWQIKSVDVR